MKIFKKRKKHESAVSKPPLLRHQSCLSKYPFDIHNVKDTSEAVKQIFLKING